MRYSRWLQAEAVYVQLVLQLAQVMEHSCIVNMTP